MFIALYRRIPKRKVNIGRILINSLIFASPTTTVCSASVIAVGMSAGNMQS
jgi:hypothetical protein